MILTAQQRTALEAAFAKYPDHRLSKYADIDDQVGAGDERAARYGLYHGMRRRVLDLGGGLGFFCASVKSAGHEAILIDLPDEQPFVETCAKIFGVEFIPYVLRCAAPLPVTGKFDLITMHRVNVIEDGSYWNWEQMFIFVEQVMELLNTRGRFVLDPNVDGFPNTYEYTLVVGRWCDWLKDRGTVSINMEKAVHTRSVANPGWSITITKT